MNWHRVSWWLLALATLLTTAPCATACERSRFKIVLDVGHSPEAPGATSARGRTEYSFNLNLAAIVAGRLRMSGFEPFVMTTPGEAWNLPQRAEHANEMGASLLLSIHHDSVQPKYLHPWPFDGATHLYSDNFKGWSLFVSTRNRHVAESLDFARHLGAELLAAGLTFTNHHAEPIPGENRAFLDQENGVYRYDGLTVLRLSDAPAVLMESGIIINREDEAALATPERQNTIAQAVTIATEKYCQER